MKEYVAILLILTVFLAGCNSPTGNIVSVDNLKHFTNETLPLEIAKLEPMNLNSVDTFDKYKSFVDKMNDLIRILNEQGDLFDIEPFNTTREGWE